MNQEKIQKLIKELLLEIGEDPHREGLLSTPKRVARTYEFLTSGYDKEIEKVLNGAVFSEKYDEMVLVKDIDFYSLCEHHMLPFFGKVHIAYIPNGKIIGLSKIPRIVEVFARRLQVQERMTQQIADTINKYIEPKGVAVVSEADHICVFVAPGEIFITLMLYFRTSSLNEFVNPSNPILEALYAALCVKTFLLKFLYNALPNMYTKHKYSTNPNCILRPLIIPEPFPHLRLFVGRMECSMMVGC